MRLPIRASLTVAMWLLVLAGCGGGGGGGAVQSGPNASFVGSGAGAAPDFVRLRQGSAAGDRVVLEVVLGGPTSSSDIYSFAFELVLGDPAVAQYVSASAVAGNILQASGGQTVSVQASQSGNRVTVGVTKLGGGAGNGSVAIEGTVLRLTFRALTSGVSTISFTGTASPSNPAGDPVALDSAGHVETSIDFDTGFATIRGS